VAVAFIVLGWGLDMVGATAAFGAFFAGRCASNGYLAYRCRGAVAAAQARLAPEPTSPSVTVPSATEVRS
jgi:hypothetical protein